MAVWWTLAGGLVGGVLLLPLVQVLLGVHPPRHRSELMPGELGLGHEDVRVETRDGVEIAAWWVPAKRDTDVALIVGHGYPMDKGDVLAALAFLAERYHLLFFDHRSFGASEGRVTTLGDRERLDVEAVISHALSRPGVERVGAVGFSLSAATILNAADDRLEAIVAEASFSDLTQLVEEIYAPFGPLAGPLAWLTRVYARLLFGIDASEVDVAARQRADGPPVLLIHGEQDAQIDVSHSQRLAHVLGDDATLWQVPGAGHGAVHAREGEAYEARVVAFLDEHLSEA